MSLRLSSSVHASTLQILNNSRPPYPHSYTRSAFKFQEKFRPFALDFPLHTNARQCHPFYSSKSSSEVKEIRCLNFSTQTYGKKQYLLRTCSHSTNDSSIPYRIPSNVLTATRFSNGGDCIRIYGPENKNVLGLGQIQLVDEFFLSPGIDASSISDSKIVLDKLIYFLEEEEEEDIGGEEGDEANDSFHSLNIPRFRHGIKIQFTSHLTNISSMSSDGLTSLTHVRESEFVPSFYLKSDFWKSISIANSEKWSLDMDRKENDIVNDDKLEKGEGNIGDNAVKKKGACVKVVCGSMAGFQSPPPLNDFTLLDVSMHPSASVEIPIPSNFDAMIYVIEGVGIFGDGSGKKENQTYQNEGHAICFPSVVVDDVVDVFDSNRREKYSSDTIIRVKCHDCSSLRFLLFSVDSTT